MLVLGALKKRGKLGTLPSQIILGLMVLQDVTAADCPSGSYHVLLADSCPAGNNGFVRLVGCTSVACRLEVQYQQQWGTVCDDGFTDTNAAVVCRSLGFTTGTNSQKELSISTLYILRS
jgi:hypothetical protein